jgi:hypothetical protein
MKILVDTWCSGRAMWTHVASLRPIDLCILLLFVKTMQARSELRKEQFKVAGTAGQHHGIHQQHMLRP